MTHVSLFSGIGGIDLAAEWAGFQTIAQVEKDPYCLAVLAKHWPSVSRCNDIYKFPDRDYGPVFLISGGPPCQPASLAGQRGGRKDDRWLWPEMLRVVRAILPRWVLAENPPGILSLENGVAIENVFAELEDSGYEILPPLIYPAASLGAVHLRYRAFVVAHSNGERLEKLNRIGQGKTHGNARPLGIQNIKDTGAPEPCLRGGNHGIRNRVDRVKALGNSVIPQQVYPILRAIAEVERTGAGR